MCISNLKETHSTWHMVTNCNRVWRRHKVSWNPNFGSFLDFYASSLPKSCFMENNLSSWTFMNEKLQTKNYIERVEICFSYLNLADEYASRIKCPRCLTNLIYNKSKFLHYFKIKHSILFREMLIYDCHWH